MTAFAKLGFGVNNQEVDVNGQTSLNGTKVTSGGILALPSNIGNHSRTTFGFVPESGFELGIRLSPCTCGIYRRLFVPVLDQRVPGRASRSIPT